ncbi:MAG: OmpA family protein [Alphaproteobacteria bacterium]|nr:OmpA family protein [Alphaproteobacteria bacterium]
MNTIIAQLKNEINQTLTNNGFGNIVTGTENPPASTANAAATASGPTTATEQAKAAEQQQTVAPELTQEQKLQKVNELRENYENMKDIETSFENRTLGATGMATMGIGGMQLATALSQDKVDNAAEQQMKAYLETFTCNYAAGKNIKGGTTNIQLPGGNELINLYSEYVGLANDLKTRKNALGLRAGIESEPILDSATSGLYDDISVGKTSGAFTSLARALSDPNGTDAAAWAAQRAETAQKKDTALKTIGIGAVATVAGNLLINYNNEEERSAEIIQKYENLKLGLDNIATEINNTANQKLNTMAKECTGNTYYSDNSGDCIECGKDQTVNDDRSGCKCTNEGEKIDHTGECTNNCTLTGILSLDGECSCGNNAIEKNGECISITQDFSSTVISAFSADNAFEPGIAELTESAKKVIQSYKDNITNALESYKDKTYCLYIIGHTDRTGWKNCKGNDANECNNRKNQEFSEDRARVVLTELGLNSDENVRAKGVGSKECGEANYQRNDSRCRKITFEITEENCE